MAILIVEDSHSQQILLRAIIQSANLSEVVLANSATQAYELLHLEDPKHTANIDLVLMDIQLPGIDGISACAKLKEAEHLQDIPIIMVTASEDKESLQQAFEAGATDYIKKPVNRLELVARVRSALQLKWQMDTRKVREKELLDLKEQLEAANARLERLSNRDGLTGIANRRHFDETLERVWGRAVNERKSVSIIMLDIDAFKIYNDTYGHLQGDECLVQVAQCLDDNLRRTGDYVARYGGEEFAVVLPYRDRKEAGIIAERLRQSIADLGLVHHNSPIEKVVTISLGVASLMPNQESKVKVQELIDQADKALYVSKAKGRNQVTVFGEAED